MTRNHDTRGGLRTLLQTLCDHTLTSEQTSRLSEVLESDSQARQHYIELVELDRSSRYWTGIEAELQARSRTAISMPANGNGHGKRYHVWLWRMSAAAALASCIAVGMRLNMKSHGLGAASGSVATDEPTAEHGVGGMAVAGRVIKFTPDSEWASNNLAIMRGTYIRPGQLLELNRGVAEVRFSSGATAILEGPASFQLVNDREGFLHFGKLAVLGESKDSGIMLATPSTRIRMKSGEVCARPWTSKALRTCKYSPAHCLPGWSLTTVP